MKMEINVYHHLGLGDHIICNGMVRHFCSNYDKVNLFCYYYNLKNVSYMYRDLKNLTLIPISSDGEIDTHPLKKIGFDLLYNYVPQVSVDVAFYKIAELDFSYRFEKFYFQRDLEKESILVEKLNPNGEKYIFIHDAPDRGFNMDMNKISTKYKIIKNDPNFMVFDYLTLIEKAEEVHFMQSSFKELICSYKLDKPVLYQHNYIRQYDSWMNTLGLNDTIEID